MCLEISNNLLLVLEDAPKRIFSMNSRVLVSQKMTQRHFFPTLHPLSTVIFATAIVLAFVLLRNSRFNFHRYTQHEATPTHKSAWKCTATSHDFSRERLQSAFTLANQAVTEFANFTLPTLKAFFEARSHNVSGNKQ